MTTNSVNHVEKTAPLKPPPPHRDSVSIVIPVLNAEKYLPALMERIFSQKPFPPDEVVIVDSNSTDSTVEIARSHERIKVISISRFSHGAARNLGVRAALGEFVVFLSQDALPKDEKWLAALLTPLEDEQVAAVYSRQIPRPEVSPSERFFLQYHFPPGQPLQRARKNGEPLSFQNVFFSNVSSATRRSLAQRFPFDEKLIMSEDQQFARDLMTDGYAVVYQPESVVVHSHNYTLKTAFKRYFDSVYSLTQIFPEHDIAMSSRIGLRYLVREASYIARHYPLHIPYYCLYTIAKTGGTVAGHLAEKLPPGLRRKFSLHGYHWTRQGL